MKTDLTKTNLDIQEMQKSYLNYIRVMNNSVKTYNMGVKKFFEYLSKEKINQPTRDDIYNFRDKLKETHKVTTVNTYLIAVRNFFSWLEYEGRYKNIAENTKGLKDNDLHKREALTQEQVKLLINSAKDLREKMLVVLTVTCGLRANEIVNIRLEDFKFENGTNVLYLLGKGRDIKVDFVVVPDSVMELKERYIKEFGITDYLFVSSSNNNKGGKITTMTVERIVNAMLERVGLKKDTVVLHSLRHTFATLSLKNGANIREVSQALRHKSVTVTEVYSHDLQAVENKCSSIVASIL